MNGTYKRMILTKWCEKYCMHEIFRFHPRWVVKYRLLCLLSVEQIQGCNYGGWQPGGVRLSPHTQIPSTPLRKNPSFATEQVSPGTSQGDSSSVNSLPLRQKTPAVNRHRKPLQCERTFKGVYVLLYFHKNCLAWLIRTALYKDYSRVYPFCGCI